VFEMDGYALRSERPVNNAAAPPVPPPALRQISFEARASTKRVKPLR
jgi:hypothetical protein